jgi:hypothetical protein
MTLIIYDYVEDDLVDADEKEKPWTKLIGEAISISDIGLGKYLSISLSLLLFSSSDLTSYPQGFSA